MADRIESFVVDVSRDTPEATPDIDDISFHRGIVREIHIIIPRGHAGKTGLQLMQANTQLIPRQPGEWIRADDTRIVWPVANFLDSGSWQARMFNDGKFNHEFHIIFLVDETQPAAAQFGVPLVFT